MSTLTQFFTVSQLNTLSLPLCICFHCNYILKKKKKNLCLAVISYMSGLVSTFLN